MNCPDWEQEIAGESERPGLEEHLRGCERCREFARELAENRFALQELTVHPAAFDAVRRRVLDEIQAKPQRAVWWGWSAIAAAACVAIICVAYVLPMMQNPAAPKPVQFAANPPKIQWAPTPAPSAVGTHRVRHHFGPVSAHAAPAEPLVVKMLTDDPNVIIIWLVDKKGDSL